MTLFLSNPYYQIFKPHSGIQFYPSYYHNFSFISAFLKTEITSFASLALKISAFVQDFSDLSLHNFSHISL